MRLAQAQPPAQPVRVWSDPTTISTAVQNLGGQAKRLIPCAGLSLPVGTCIGYCQTMSDGAVILPLASQSGSSVIDGAAQYCAVLYPSGEAQVLSVPSTTGLYNPADLSDVHQWYDANGVEHAVCASISPYYTGSFSVGVTNDLTTVTSTAALAGWAGYWITGSGFVSGTTIVSVTPGVGFTTSNEWTGTTNAAQGVSIGPIIAVNGLQPTFAVFTKSGSFWAYNAALSVTDNTLYASNTTEANRTNCIVEKVNGYGETYAASLGITEFSVLPNRQLACVQYFNDAALYVNSCMLVIDLDAQALVCSYRLPVITDPTGGNTLPAFTLAGRSVTADPTGTATAMPIIWLFDLFAPNGNSAGSQHLQILSISAASGVVTINTNGAHGYGIGQWVAITGLPTAFAALNDAPFFNGTNVITSVPTSTSFTIIDYSFPNTSLTSVSTTIAAGSNGAVLPQTAIDVANSGVLSPSGDCYIAIGSSLVEIAYTGRAGGDSITGCTGGNGQTLLTGQVASNGICHVKQGSPAVEMVYNPTLAVASMLSPNTQMFLTDQEFGNVGTCIIDSAGNAIFNGEDGQHDFTNAPLRIFLKATRAAGYGVPYNAATFASSYGDVAIRDVGVGAVVSTVEQAHPVFLAGGVVWQPVKSNANLAGGNPVLRTKLTYPLAPGANIQPDPNLTLGTLTFGDEFASAAYSTTTLPALPSGGGNVTHSIKITPAATIGPSQPAVYIIENLAVTAGQSVSGSAWFISPSQAGAYALGFYWFDANAVDYSGTYVNPVWLSANAWVQIFYDTIAPTAAAFGAAGSHPAHTCALAFQGVNLTAVAPFYVTGLSVSIPPAQSLSAITLGQPSGQVLQPNDMSIDAAGQWLTVPWFQTGFPTGAPSQYVEQVDAGYYAGVS